MSGDDTMRPPESNVPAMPDERPVLSQINLVTANLAASVEFYRQLGVEIPDARGDWNDHHRTAEFEGTNDIDFDIDSTAFATHWGSEGVPTGPLVVFRVSARDAVDALYAELTAAGHRGLREPYDAFWGARYAIIEDPGGVAVGLMSEAAEQYRTAPPDVSTFN